MEKNMQYNFANLTNRVLDALEKTDLENLKSLMKGISSPTIITGVGGSKVVSDYASKVLNSKNGIIATSLEPRDLIYQDLSGYQNVLSCSYGGKNYGVTTSFANNLQKFLLSSIQRDEEDITNLTYETTLPPEKSFISLAATLIPMSILLAYYTDNDISLIREILSKQPSEEIKPAEVFEILSGQDTKTTSTYLDSTLTEAGLGTPLIHDKYSYCHGRSTLSYDKRHSLIHLNRNTELDTLFKEILPPYYANVTELTGEYSDPVIDDYYLTYQAMLLTKKLAEQEGKDLSGVDYSPVVKKIYHFQGRM